MIDHLDHSDLSPTHLTHLDVCISVHTYYTLPQDHPRALFPSLLFFFFFVTPVHSLVFAPTAIIPGAPARAEDEMESRRADTRRDHLSKEEMTSEDLPRGSSPLRSLAVSGLGSAVPGIQADD